MDDVKGSPEWAAVADEARESLSGKVMMAQNVRFEREWLSHHFTAVGSDWDKWGPFVDTMAVAQQHEELDNYRLATICEAAGVEYTDGHRATHDAIVAGEAFFALRSKIQKSWKDDPVLSAIPQP